VAPWTIASLLDTATGYLREKGSTSPRLDAEVLLAESLETDRVRLYTEFDRPLSTEEVDRYRALVARRAAREPVAYITGRAHFRHLVLEVSPAVLIPRPETEELVDIALQSLRRRPLLGEGVGGPLVVDVGTGSGAIAVSLAQEAGVRVLAVDSSAEASQLAARNAVAAGVEGLVEFREADLLTGVAAGSLRLVVSNPPYVRTGDMASLDLDIRLYEPASALDAGPDGQACFRRLLPAAARALGPGGSAILEVGDGQAGIVATLAREAGFHLITVHKDMSQKDRMVEATLPGALAMAVEGLDATNTGLLKAALREGAVIGVPTDTVYGIGAAWDSSVGVRKLFEAKGRPAEQPVAVLFPSVEAVEEAVSDLDEACVRVLRALLPGPFTFVVTTTVSRPPDVGSVDSLGVRVPGDPCLSDLLRRLDTPLAATSANVSGGREVPDLSGADPEVLAHCSVAFRGPVARSGDVRLKPAASTVVDLRPLGEGGVPVVIREGVVQAGSVLERIAALF